MRFPDGARVCTSVPPPAPDPITMTSYAFDMPPPPLRRARPSTGYRPVTPGPFPRPPPGRELPMPAAAPDLQAHLQDLPLVEALRAGDERAFLGLVGRLHAGMVRFARGFVNTDAAAEDVVQDTWAAMLEGIDGFEGRSALRSWIFGILATLARTRATLDQRAVPLSALQRDECEPAVDPSDFLPASHPRCGGHWANYPEAWPEAQLLSQE